MTEPNRRALAAEQHIERLAKANVESNETMRRLVENVRHDADMREKKISLLEAGLRQTHRLLWLMGVVLLSLVTLGATNAINLHRTAQQARTIARTSTDAQKTYALLLDCLNQAGECGSKNSAATKALLDDVKHYGLIVHHCAVAHPADDKQFLACVADLYPGGPPLTK